MKKTKPSPTSASPLNTSPFSAQARETGIDLCRFIDASPMPYQACAEITRRLRAAGYQPLDEADRWKLEPGRGYFVTRAGTTVVAFRVGRQAPAETGFRIVGAHVDSPNLRIKPNAETTSFGYRQLGVEVYGGAIVASWLDRDLGLAGRVVLAGRGGAQRTALVEIRRPIARISNLAIHLNRKINDDGLKLDKQRHLPPMLALDDTSPAGEEWSLRALLAPHVGCRPEDILSFDLGLFDLQPCSLGGLHDEFVFAPRLDNLGSSHAATVAMCDGMTRVKGAPETTWIAALYDHEECGSQSTQGAMGTVLRDVMTRLAAGHPDAGKDAVEASQRAFARSFMISADMAHAIHPNYAEMHEPEHRPRLNRGPVVKRNDNQRYATDGDSGARFIEYCRAAGFEPQVFVSRSDVPCGTTIGPIAAAVNGVQVVDVGNPMLSMHSIRECCGTYDQHRMVAAFSQNYV